MSVCVYMCACMSVYVQLTRDIYFNRTPFWIYDDGQEWESRIHFAELCCLFLFKELTYIKITSASHSFRSYSAKSKLDVFCEIKKLPNTSSEIWNSLHLLSK